MQVNAHTLQWSGSLVTNQSPLSNIILCLNGLYIVRQEMQNMTRMDRMCDIILCAIFCDSFNNLFNVLWLQPYWQYYSPMPHLKATWHGPSRYLVCVKICLYWENIWQRHWWSGKYLYFCCFFIFLFPPILSLLSPLFWNVIQINKWICDQIISKMLFAHLAFCSFWVSRWKYCRIPIVVHTSSQERCSSSVVKYLQNKLSEVTSTTGEDLCFWNIACPSER